jgi:uncharacterized protein (TIGR02284 family)
VGARVEDVRAEGRDAAVRRETEMAEPVVAAMTTAAATTATAIAMTPRSISGLLMTPPGAAQRIVPIGARAAVPIQLRPLRLARAIQCLGSKPGGIRMRGETDKSVEALNGLLRGEISAVETYRQAIEKLSDSAVRGQLEDCQRSHELRVDKLRNQVERLGGEPAKGSGPWGAFARLFEGGAKAFGERAAVAALEEGEDHGLKLYRGDLDKLDTTARVLVETDLLPAQEQTHRYMSTLKHTLH